MKNVPKKLKTPFLWLHLNTRDIFSPAKEEFSGVTGKAAAAAEMNSENINYSFNNIYICLPMKNRIGFFSPPAVALFKY